MSNFAESLKRANERYAAMSPDEQAAMWKAQRESWVRAFSTPCEHGKLDFEQCLECRTTPRSTEVGEKDHEL